MGCEEIDACGLYWAWRTKSLCLCSGKGHCSGSILSWHVTRKGVGVAPSRGGCFVVFVFGVNNEYHGVGSYSVEVSVVPGPLSTYTDLKFQAHIARGVPEVDVAITVDGVMEEDPALMQWGHLASLIAKQWRDRYR